MNLLEAARLDGCNEFQIFRKIVLPLSGPLIAVLVVFSIVWRWNDFSWPLVVLTDQKNFMLQQGMNLIKGDPNPNWNTVMALALDRARTNDLAVRCLPAFLRARYRWLWS